MKKKVKVNLPHKVWIICVLLSLIMGAWYGFFMPYDVTTILVLGALLIGFSFIWKHPAIVVLGVMCALFFALGMIRMSLALSPATDRDIRFYNGRDVVIVGIVTNPPDIRADREYLIVQTEYLTNQGEKKDVLGNIRITVPLYSNLEFGDEIMLHGRLLFPTDLSDFSYTNYLAKDDIFTLMFYPTITVIQKNRGNFLYQILYQIRVACEKQIGILFPEPNGSLLAGLLLGIRKSIPSELADALQRTGLTHLIALSGFNITIIITFVAGMLFSRFRRSIRFILSLVFVVLFVILVGASPSVVRAAIMGTMGLFALMIGRKSDALIMLLFTLCVMTIIHPTSLVLDLGLQLSFLATLGLVTVVPILSHLLRRMPSCLWVKEVLITTLSAQIMVIPLLMHYFGTLSLLSCHECSYINDYSNNNVFWIYSAPCFFFSFSHYSR